MNAKQERFVQTVWEHYERHGRHSLPWRRFRDPYKILVSEIMLQQTQTERVIPKYHAFLKRFKDAEALANASLGEVLKEWQGLGYNRRAKMLHAAAREVVARYGGTFPRTYEGLVALPGIGPYTAGAILAFAYNEAHPLIETNLRTVYIHHFYSDSTDVDDKELLVLIEETLDKERPREWYAALMDYGAYIKTTIGNPNSRSKQYAKQSAFKGSDREIRGALLKLLALRTYTRVSFHRALPFDPLRIDAQLEKLLSEGLIEKSARSYRLPST